MSKPRPLFLIALALAVGLVALVAFQADLDLRDKPEPTTEPRGMVPDAAGAAGTQDPPALVTGLDTPWDLAWGPDGRIWVSERFGRISRVDPSSGSIEVLGEVDDVFENGESGLMGLAFHPDFESQPYVYAAHTYRGLRGLRNRLVRMRWDGARLGEPQTLLDDIPGAGNHDGSRLAVGPDGFLYMTTGDASAQRHPHDLDSPAGKILRLTPEGEPAPGNPFGSVVYSFGHRNPQGLAFHPETGLLYSTEHGPDRADEVNRIVAGGDYGWPEVRGACDAGGEEARYCSEHDVVEPLWEWTPTVGISGLAVYVDGPNAGWRNSLLATSLRGGRLFRLPLSDDGLRVGEPEVVFEGAGRLRDVLVAPDGTVYVATSNRDGRGRPSEDDDQILIIRPDGAAPTPASSRPVPDEGGAPFLASNAFWYYADLEAATDFYTRTLGLRVAADYGFAKILQIGETAYLTLVDETRGMHSADEPKTVALALVTDQLDEWWTYLSVRDIEMRHDYEPEEGSAHDGFVAIDPEGYLLEFERFNPHPENHRFHPVLERARTLPAAAGSDVPEGLGFKAAVLWLYYRDLEAMQRFWEGAAGLELVADQGWTKIYQTSPTGFLGLVDESRGMHSFTEDKAVTVSLWTDRLGEWFSHARAGAFELRSDSIETGNPRYRAFVGYDPEGYFLELDTFLAHPDNTGLPTESGSR